MLQKRQVASISLSQLLLVCFSVGWFLGLNEPHSHPLTPQSPENSFVPLTLNYIVSPVTVNWKREALYRCERLNKWFWATKPLREKACGALQVKLHLGWKSETFGGKKRMFCRYRQVAWLRKIISKGVYFSWHVHLIKTPLKSYSAAHSLKGQFTTKSNSWFLWPSKKSQTIQVSQGEMPLMFTYLHAVMGYCISAPWYQFVKSSLPN